MKARDFLQQLLPSAGYYFTGTFTAQGSWRNTPHITLDSAATHLATLSAQGQHAYFALAAFEKERYTDKEGKVRRRTQLNARALRSFFLDLDVDPANPQRFPSKEAAAADLLAFVKRVGLPLPMLVDSGGGLHVYWPLTAEVPKLEWQPVADQLKALCKSEGLRVDMTVPADAARVLRGLGTANPKRGGAVVTLLRPTKPVSFTDFATRLESYTGAKPACPKPATLPGAPVDPFEEGNLGATNDPVNFDHVMFGCQQLQQQVNVRGRGVPEPLWRAALGIVKFSHNPEPAWRALSDGHDGFDAEVTKGKIENWKTGPTLCATFHEHNPSLCEACPSWGRIKSPVSLGRSVDEAPPPVVAKVDVETGATVETLLPDPPSTYKRKTTGEIVKETEDKEGNLVHTEICPFDLYPVAEREQVTSSGEGKTYAQWRMHLPDGMGKTEPIDVVIPNGVISDLKALHKYFMEKRGYLTGDQVKSTQQYMIAYLKLLSESARRERMYDHLGWQDGRKAFMLGEQVFYADGSRKQQSMNPTVAAAVGETGLRPAGTLAAWKKAMAFYNRPGLEGHRFFLYAALGAPIFHMNDTGNKGVLMTANGQSGRGKTTVLKACASLWGHPEALLQNGNKDGATTNAMYASLGAVHSLPYLWDDITERDQDETRRFVLNISTGQGKRRMGRDGMAMDRSTWETIVLASSNADEISALLGGGRDNSPHLMRMISVEFNRVDTSASAKIDADNFLRALMENHGHAGSLLAPALVTQYKKIQARYIKNVELVDRLLASDNASAERFWGATVAAAYTGAQLAQTLGLIDYPVESDLKWMIAHIKGQRTNMAESLTTPCEHLTLFLNAAQRDTLILGSRAASTLDNVVQRPYNELRVRHELDSGHIYVDRTSISSYCTDKNLAFKPLEKQLKAEGVLLDHMKLKTLGADTIYSKGQTRCWLIDASKLEGLDVPVPAAPFPTNVLPLKGKAA